MSQLAVYGGAVGITALIQGLGQGSGHLSTQNGGTGPKPRSGRGIVQYTAPFLGFHACLAGSHAAQLHPKRTPTLSNFGFTDLEVRHFHPRSTVITFHFQVWAEQQFGQRPRTWPLLKQIGSFAVAFGCRLSLPGFLVAFALQTEVFYDILGGLNFLSITLWPPGLHAEPVVRTTVNVGFCQVGLKQSRCFATESLKG